MERPSCIKIPCYLRGRQHHRQGDPTRLPLVVDRQAWNSKDANALSVRDGANRSLGFVDKDTAAILGPLLRAGYIAELDLIPIEQEMPGCSQLACRLEVHLEQSSAENFWNAAERVKTFGTASGIKAPSSGGFVRASMLQPAFDSDELRDASQKLLTASKKDSNSLLPSTKSQGKLARPKSANTSSLGIMSYFKADKPMVEKKAPHIPERISDQKSRTYTPRASLSSISMANLLKLVPLEQYLDDHDKQSLESVIPSFAEWQRSRKEIWNVVARMESPTEPVPFECRRVYLHSHQSKFMVERHIRDEDSQLSQTLALSMIHEIDCCSRRSMDGLRRLTAEQKRILKAPLTPGSFIRIRAYAGAGKTTTLLSLAKSNPNKRILYLCFNKSVQMDASKRFPSNVQCRTVHSLAFEVTKLNAYACEQDDDIGAVANWLTKRGVDTADEEVSFIMVRNLVVKLNAFLNGGNCGDADELLLQLWEAMKKGEVPMTYAGVLKLCASSRPHLDFDVILLDEAQDCNPVALEIIFAQSHCARILVGDPNQAIYAFLNAKNALSFAPEASQCAESNIQDYELTRSFRFGQKLGSCVSRFLSLAGRRNVHGQPICILGVPNVNSTLIDNSEETLHGFIDRVKRDVPLKRNLNRSPSICYLARTNSSCIEAMVDLLENDKEVSISVLGGMASARLNDMVSVADLILRCQQSERSEKRIRVGNQPSLPARFDSLETFTHHCRTRGRTEWLTVLNAVKRLGAERVLDMAKILQTSKRVINDTSKAEVVFSTVHRAKGLEFDAVYVADDFDLSSALTESRAYLNRLDEETINLLYVAFTRARHYLSFNKAFCRHPHARIILLGALLRSPSLKRCPECAWCGTVQRSNVGLRGLPFSYCAESVVSRGYFCEACLELSNK